MTEDHRYSVSVAGVIVDDEGRALIIQRRDNGHWEPPGGILEHGETVEDGLRRELYEETGLVAHLVALTGVYQNMSRNVIALVFRCRAIGGSLTTTSEVKDHRWVPREQLRDLMTEAYWIRVEDAIDGKLVGVRAHDGSSLLIKN